MVYYDIIFELLNTKKKKRERQFLLQNLSFRDDTFNCKILKFPWLNVLATKLSSSFNLFSKVSVIKNLAMAIEIHH